jgi:hypothetical protein
VEFHKKALLEKLCALDKIEVERALVVEEKVRKSLVITKLEKTTLLEQISWRQTLVINALSFFTGFPKEVWGY